MTPGITLESINFSFGQKKVIDTLSLDIEQGHIVCLLGPSGCGKTTTLRLLAGLEHPDSGRILFDHREVAGHAVNVPTEKRRVGLLFQDYALFPHLNVRKNIAFGLQKVSGAASLNMIKDMLAMVEMSDYAEAMPHELSGGQQQRIALARALAPNPNVLLLDEPFSGLDTALRIQLRFSTHKILKRNKITTVMVTHDPEEAMYMADKIVLMQAGKVVQIGTPRDLYLQPNGLFCANFFGDVCRFPARLSNGHLVSAVGHCSVSDLPSRLQSILESGSDHPSWHLYFRPELLEVTSVIQSDLNALSADLSGEKDAVFEVIDIHFIGEKQLLTLVPMADSGHSEANRQPIDSAGSITLKADAKTRVNVGSYITLAADFNDLLWLEKA